MMRLSVKLAAITLLLTFSLSAVSYSQSARLEFDNLKPLEDRAADVVEINIEGKILNLAKRVLAKVNDKDAKIVGKAIQGLEAIYVRVLRFEYDNEYNIAEVDAIRNQLQSPGWEKLANVRSRKDNQKIDVYTMFSGDDISGVAVVMSEKRSIALVNVIGPIDIDLLTQLGGKLNIPEIDIETDDGN